jgi:MerR family transcriptional regulator, heat shock protein HspR
MPMIRAVRSIFEDLFADESAMNDETKKPRYMISVAAQTLGIHPQTLRIYEREGLIGPTRTKGNTRLYSDEDIELMRVILRLTQDLGVNLAGVDIILQMRRQMDQMREQLVAFSRISENQGPLIPDRDGKQKKSRGKPVRIKIEKG